MPKKTEEIMHEQIPMVIHTEANQHQWTKWADHDQKCHCGKLVAFVCLCGAMRAE